MSKKFKIVDSLIIFSILLSNTIENAFAKRRIYNGVEVNIENFPWHAVIHYNGGFRCGGSIISESHVLTAAHCAVRKEDGARDDPAGFTIQYGANRLDDNSGSYVRISSVRVHESYDHVHTKTNDNDLAILFTSTPILFSRFASATKLSTTAPAGGDRVVVSGHGVTETGSLSNDLRAAIVRVIGGSDCYGPYWYVTRNMVCLFEPRRSSCSGDSGGPIISRFAVQVALVSSGWCGHATEPTFATNLPNYRSWIDSVTNNAVMWVDK